MSIWTDISTAKLKKLHKQGRSARFIAEELGAGFTRNAVIGKLHRMGLSHPAVKKEKPEIIPKKKPMYVAEIKPANPVKFKPLPVTPVEVTGEVVPFMSMKAKMCWYPVEERQNKHFFCGLPTKEGSYCPDHHKIVYISKPEAKRHGQEIRVREKPSRLLSNTYGGAFRFDAKA